MALPKHKAPVSRITAIAVRLLRRQSPGIKCVIAFADPEQNHHGGVYQAMGFQYVGSSTPQSEMIINGRPMHKRSCHSRWGTASVPRLLAMGLKDVQRDEVRRKHTYALGLDAEMRAKLAPMAEPYPKRVKQATTGHPSVSGGAAPTHTLQTA